MTSYLDFLRANARALFAGFALAVLSSFGQTFFISVFAGAILEDYGLSTGRWGALYLLGTTVSAGLMVFAGALADRFRVRLLASWVLAGLAASCLGMALGRSVILLPVIVLGLRFFGQGMLSHLSGVAMARWFTARRGRALAVAGMGFAAGQAVLPVVYVALLESVGYRALWTASAVLLLALIWPLRRLLAAEPAPGDAARSAPGAAGRIGGRHWSRAELLRLPLFWLLVPLLLASPTFGTALFFLQVHLAESRGWSHLGLVALFPVFTAATVAAGLASGWAVDRFGAPRVLPWTAVPMAAGFALLWAAPGLLAAAPALALIGLTTGTMGTVTPAFWAEEFGTRHVGAIKALATAVLVFGSAVGPGLCGALIDAGHDFTAQMPWIALYTLLASALAALALHRTPQAPHVPAGA